MQGLDVFITDVMKEWHVPGLGLVVVKDGEVIVSKGFGLRDVEQNLPVTPDTLFAIGSSTKAVTTLSMGLLIDEGKLDWDTPVREYLPTFRLADTAATERMTPRDLVCHRSGLPRHDLVWYNSPASREELFSRLRYLEPSSDFRTTWQYQNLMYMTAGYLVGALAGTSWEEFVQQRIFAPLGMGVSNFSVQISQQSDDVALPYREKDEQVEQIPFRDISTVGPAGSINSSMNDMAQWLLLQLNKGKVGEQQLISEGNLAQMHTPQMVRQEPVRFDEVLPIGYGLGWFIDAYRGRLLIHHGGNIDGFSAMVAFLPRDNIGVVTIANLNASPLPQLVAYNVFDRLLELAEIPWSERAHKLVDEQKAALEKGKETSSAERRPNTHPSHDLTEYAGVYHHPGYGRLTVTLVDDILSASINDLLLEVEHYHYDIFECVLNDWDLRVPASFITDVSGNIASVAIPLEPSTPAIVFTRVPDESLRDRAFLEPFVGAYESEVVRFTIALRGENALTLTIPGQPIYELEPYQNTMFTLKGIPNVSITFNADDTGNVTEAQFKQAGAVFVVRRVR
jgi:CubicO group peptidase (beta-lactamase class C family)